MSYDSHFFGYTNHFAVDNDGGEGFGYWHLQNQQPQFGPLSQPTVAPHQISHRSSAYHPARIYDSDQRYHNTNRHNVGVTPGMRPIVVQQMSPSASIQGFNTYNAERQVRETPPVMVEVRTQPSKPSQRYYCEFQDCDDPNTGKRRSLSRRADLRRHVLSMHGEPTIDCHYKKCSRKGHDGFCREDHYREHLRGYHNQELPPKKATRRNS